MYTQSSLGLAIALAWFAYCLVVFCVKAKTYPKSMEPPRPFPKRWIAGHEASLLFSLDFWFANCFKNRIAQFVPRELSQGSLKKFIQDNNRVNVWISVAFLLCVIASHTLNGGSMLRETVASMCILRFFSRSWEIGFAFGRDALYGDVNRSGLDKYERLRLALWSYTEIFVYSAAAYLALSIASSWLDALTLSLNVGTLTNVGIAFGAGSTWLNDLAFVQVFTTMSLVVLSLAAYLARSA